ncbi:MAG: hypothetical protein KF858_08215 [Candidatus Sumerlaeia bacterium]|nr:hypothetical protein [Candidatus Sumerlaeia bacterium]
MNTVSDLEVLLIGAGLFVLATILLFILKRLRRSDFGDTPGLSPRELQELERRQLLNEEEKARVRQAMARQFARREEHERSKLELAEGRRGIEALALEAERLEHVRPAPSHAAPALPLAPPPELPSVPLSPALPETLIPLLDRPREELDDLVAAGFLSDADRARVLHARGESPEAVP